MQGMGGILMFLICVGRRQLRGGCDRSLCSHWSFTSSETDQTTWRFGRRCGDYQGSNQNPAEGLSLDGDTWLVDEEQMSEHRTWSSSLHFYNSLMETKWIFERRIMTKANYTVGPSKCGQKRNVSKGSLSQWRDINRLIFIEMTFDCCLNQPWSWKSNRSYPSLRPSVWAKT